MKYLETAKTIALTAVVMAVVAFVFGYQYGQKSYKAAIASAKADLVVTTPQPTTTSK